MIHMIHMLRKKILSYIILIVTITNDIVNALASSGQQSNTYKSCDLIADGNICI